MSAAETREPGGSTVVELLRDRAGRDPQKTIYTFVSDLGAVQAEVTYGELDRRARIVAAKLQEETAAGARVLLLYPPGVEFIVAFLGCLYAGVVAVPCYPPGLTRSGAEAARKIALDCGASVLLTSSAWSTEPALRRALGEASQRLQWIATEELDAGRASAWRETDVAGSALAFLQYTSGTTAEPKGVMVAHDNLLANLDAIRRGFALTPRDRGVLWLPPYHDMGLIGGILGPLFCDFPVTLMAPATFLRRPLVWLQCISERRATAAGGPNFAYEMCTRAARATKKELRLDLSSWKMAFTGAEMVRVETMTRFVETFAPYGFDARAVAPCYGMAEATLLCTVSPRLRGLVHEPSPRPEPLDDSTATGTSHLASCGAAPPGTDVRIVDPNTRRPRGERQLGEVWVSGASVAKGYWGRPELSRRVFEATLADGTGPFLRTGDRGFFAGGELYLAGRLKDLIIVRGRNYAAEDIEGSLREVHPAIKPHRVVAFSVETDGAERLVVSLEYAKKELPPGGALEPELAEAIARTVRRRVLEVHGLFVDSVVVLRSGATPLTTSGKLKRRACRDAFVAGELPALAVLGAESAGRTRATRRAS